MVAKKTKKVKRGGSIKMLKGGAWYDDLWSGVKKVGEKVLDVGLPLLAKVALGGGGRTIKGCGNRQTRAKQIQKYVIHA